MLVYEWPNGLRFKTFLDWIDFEIYLTAVAPPLENPLDLPTSFYSREHVSEDFPELVQSSFKVFQKTLFLGQAALRASLREVRDWQLEETNWNVLRASFSYLPQGCSREDRFQGLQKLKELQRSEIDSFARLRLLEQHPEWIEEALSLQGGQEQTISISKAGSNIPGLEKPWRLYSLLEKKSEELLSYRDNDKILYSFEGVERILAPHILTFEEAKTQGVLSKIRERSLSLYYLKERDKFKSADGSWKPFSEVQTDVAKLYFAKAIVAIEHLEKRTWSDDLYAKYRLLPVTKEAYRDLQNHSEDSNWTRRNEEESLEKQFRFLSNVRSIQRTSNEEWMKEKAFFDEPK